MPMTDLGSHPDAMRPIWDNIGDSQGLTQAGLLTGEQWGDRDGAMAAAWMGIGVHGTPIGQRIDILERDDDLQVTGLTPRLDAGRFRSLPRPDGSLCVAMHRGEAVRMMPPGSV
jgi:hypothetical protein